MEGINPKWYIWMLQEQRKYNMILAFGTIIIALVGILQIMKLYGMLVPTWFLFIIGGGLTLLIGAILIIILERYIN